MKVFSERLTELRKEKYRNRDDFANHMGINVHTYKTYESGRNEPKFDVLLELANEFDVSTDYLLGIVDIRKPYEESDRQGECDLLGCYRRLDSSGKEALDAIARWMVKSSKEK